MQQMLDFHNCFADDAAERGLYFWLTQNSHLTHVGCRFGRADHVVPRNADAAVLADTTVVHVADYTHTEADVTEPANEHMRGHELF